MGDFLRSEDFNYYGKAVVLFTPCAYGINYCASQVQKDRPVASRFISAMEYFTTPVDRVLQLLFVSVASVIHDIKKIKEDRRKGIKACGISLWKIKSFFSPIAMPAKAIYRTFLFGIGLLCNAAVNLLPYKLISAFILDRPRDFFQAREQVRYEIDQKDKRYFDLDDVFDSINIPDYMMAERFKQRIKMNNCNHDDNQYCLRFLKPKVYTLWNQSEIHHCAGCKRKLKAVPLS